MPDNSSTVSNILVMGKSGAGKQPRIDVLVNEFGLKQLSTGDMFRSYLKKFDSIEFEGNVQDFYDDEKGEFMPDKEILAKLGPVAEWDDPEGLLLGLKAKCFVEAGKFVPDYITNAMFEAEFVGAGCKGLVLDGYPRTVPQAELLLNLVLEKGANIDAIVLVDGDDDQIVTRTTGRRICPSCKKVYHIEHKPARDGKYCVACGTEVIQRSDDKEEKIRSRLEEFQNKALPTLKFLESQSIPVATVPGNLPVFTDEAVRESVMAELTKIIK